MNPLNMNDYQTEQWNAQNLALEAISRLQRTEKDLLLEKIHPYTEYRRTADLFLSDHFGAHCTRNCYENRLSACCSKDGIITFWADIVINALLSVPEQLKDWAAALSQPAFAHKCTYLGPSGCRWRVRPLMCVLFLCDEVMSRVFAGDNSPRTDWEAIRKQADDFRWPDKPVLFDWLEAFFMQRGVHSPLMYIHQSPGLRRVKQKAGWQAQAPAGETSIRSPVPEASMPKALKSP
jgi:hypothetical protein